MKLSNFRDEFNSISTHKATYIFSLRYPITDYVLLSLF